MTSGTWTRPARHASYDVTLPGRWQAYALGPSWERRHRDAHSGPYHHDSHRYNYEHGHTAPGGAHESRSARSMKPDDAARVRSVSLVALHHPSCRMRTQVDVRVLFLYGDTLVVSRTSTAHPENSIEEADFRQHRCLCVTCAAGTILLDCCLKRALGCTVVYRKRTLRCLELLCLTFLSVSQRWIGNS